MNIMSEAAVEKALDQKMNTVPLKMIGKDVSVYYGEKRALFDVNLNIRENTVTALIGPSGCGKSTFLRTLNRMNDTIENCRVTGRITLDEAGHLPGFHEVADTCDDGCAHGSDIAHFDVIARIVPHLWR